VGHNPQTTAAGLRGMWPTTPVERGTWATTPTRGHASRRVLAATCHTVNMAWITRRRAEQAGRLGIGQDHASRHKVALMTWTVAREVFAMGCGN